MCVCVCARQSRNVGVNVVGEVSIQVEDIQNTAIKLVRILLKVTGSITGILMLFFTATLCVNFYETLSNDHI